MFKELEKINARPKPFEFYTAADLWTDEHTSERMLYFHLNGDIDVSSRNNKFIEKSIEWIIAHFNVVPGMKIADFGCGPGLYALGLAKGQADVTGIDFSPRSIRYAKTVAAEAGLNIRYINQNYLDFETDERYDLILMIMCDFCALGPDQRKRILTKFRTLLKPEGSILLDVYSLNAYKLREESASYGVNFLDGFWSSKMYYAFLNIFKYEKENVVLDKYTIVEGDGMRTVYNWLQYYNPDEIEKEFGECRLAVKELYGDVAGAPFDPKKDEFAVVAGKQ